MSGGGGGGGGPLARVAAMGNPAPAQGGVRYSAPPAANPYQPTFNSQQALQQRPMSPLVQQQMMRQQQPMFNPMQQQSSGLQAAMMHMMGRQNQPMMRPQMQGIPQFRSQALGFRPNLEGAMQGLSRVAPSVELQQRQAAEAAAAAPQDIYYGSSGG